MNEIASYQPNHTPIHTDDSTDSNTDTTNNTTTNSTGDNSTDTWNEMYAVATQVSEVGSRLENGVMFYLPEETLTAAVSIPVGVDGGGSGNNNSGSSSSNGIVGSVSNDHLLNS